MNWFERYEREIESLEPAEFVEELRVAAEDFLAQGLNAELDAWVATDPQEFLGR